MKRPLLALLLAAFAAPAQEGSSRPGRTRRDAVNIRARAALDAEVIGQLQRGDEVRARGEVTVTNQAPGEPALWYIIELPATVKLWVHADFLDAATGAVKVKRLNVRAGPSEDFSIVGRIEEGTVVTELARQDDWVQIGPPPGVFGFVASQYLEVESPRAGPEPATTTPPPRETSPPATGTETPAEAPVQPAPQDAPAPNPPPPQAGAPAPTPATTVVAPLPTEAGPDPAVAADALAVSPEPAPLSSGSSLQLILDAAGEPRVVRREGKLTRAWNIQAPGFYAVRDLETGRVMNYLHGERFADRRWSGVLGRTVVITGREFLDARWPNLPVLEAERVEIVR